MSQVAIEKVPGNRPAGSSTLDEVKTLSDRIRQRAFELFERRGGISGSAMDDWLSAERDLFRIPESELVERDGKFEARISAPGFDPADVHVTALPDAPDCQRFFHSQARYDRGCCPVLRSSTRKRCSAALTCRNRSTWIE